MRFAIAGVRVEVAIVAQTLRGRGGGLLVQPPTTTTVTVLRHSQGGERS